MLGQALAQGTGDYANLQIRQRDEERRRMQQLQDIEDARSFTQSQQDRLHGLQVSDEERRHAQSINDETYGLLLKEGWLKPSDANNPDAIAKAADARQRHIDKQMASGETERTNATSRAAQLATERQAVQGKIAQLAQVLSENEPEPDRRAVLALAIQQASQGLKQGERPSEAAISQQMDAAYKTLSDRAMSAWFQRKNDAAIQLQGLRAQLADISNESNVLANKFGVVGVPTAQTSPLAAPEPVAAAPRGNPADFIASLKAAVAKERPDLVPPPTPTPALADPAFAPLENPTNNAMVAAENTRRLQAKLQADQAGAAQAQQPLADSYNQSLDRLAAVKDNIRRGTAGQPINPQDLYSFGENIPLEQNPSTQAQLMSRLLMSEQALTREANDNKRKMLGLSPAQVLANPVTTDRGPALYDFGADAQTAMPAASSPFAFGAAPRGIPSLSSPASHYPQVPAATGGMRDMTDQEKQAYDIGQQVMQGGGFGTKSGGFNFSER